MKCRRYWKKISLGEDDTSSAQKKILAVAGEYIVQYIPHAE